MDEVDIDNVEDLNELEARLYAQIHHEATDGTNVEFGEHENDSATGISANSYNKQVYAEGEKFHETSAHTRRILARRYWAGGDASQILPSKQQVSKKRFLRNPFKASNKQDTQKSYSVENTKQVLPPAVSHTESRKNKNSKTEEYSSGKEKMPREKSNLKLNPVADWLQRNRNLNTKKSNKKAKQGPFAKQKLKLQKAKRLEDKKQKSKKAKTTAGALANKLKPTEIIYLDTDNESDSSDIIVIPTAPPPTYTVDDSGDENNKEKVTNIIEHEENALDSTDVQMSSTSTSFIKPQSLATTENAEKRLENFSRCTSPCSIQSSDDFIGQTDRSRLLAGASGMADDEDLLVLTSDMNSLLEAPQTGKQPMAAEEKEVEIDLEPQVLPLNSSAVRIPEENVKTNDSLEFATPIASKPPSRPKDYRVDQGHFRALDVYESESDITDSIYSKGANKTTVIRQIDSSSDEVEDNGICSQRTKRLRKRRASSSNKESDPNNENSLSSSDNGDDDEEHEDDNKVLRTALPFISKGPAVERCKPRKRSRTLFTCSPMLQKKKSAKVSVSSGHMSDTEFINTLHNLVQGQEGDEQDGTDESETENIPTARDIAEKILGQHKDGEQSDKPTTQNSEIAVPENVLNELDKVFETIDQLDKLEFSTAEGPVQISDSSDSDREKHLIYKSTPNEEAQIIEYYPAKTKETPASYRQNGSPIYHVIYTRGQRKPGGIGWNEEMRRFYNKSWNGEHFILHKVLQNMNPDKNLWKIHIEDRFNLKSNRRHNNVKCTNCCEFGHMRSKCKRPRKPMICYMCGESGHHEPRCPNTICLRCGNKTQVFTKSCNACSYQNRLICPICKIRGHSLDYCPDKWRRYHSTIEPNIYPNSTITYNTRKFCCICGGRGHLSDNCRSAVRFMEYPTIVSNIKSHQKSYSDVVVRTPHNGIALNLMYDPCQKYRFELAEATSLDKYYGRFLKAVNLDFILKRKRQLDMEPSEVADTAAKKSKRLAKRYEANPYSKVGTANQKNIESLKNAPNQVQEISESGNIEEQDEEPHQNEEVIDLDDNSIANDDSEVELIGSTVDDDVGNIELNIITNKTTTAVERSDEDFKSPKKIKIRATATSTYSSSKTRIEPEVVLDSDSNYSFSEHFDDVPSTSVKALASPNTQDNLLTEENFVIDNSIPKPREIEVLPDFIPLIDSTEDRTEQNSDNENPIVGISRRFVAAETDDEMEEERPKNLTTLSELPCEAKIYLTHFHSKYLLSPLGNAFLVKVSTSHKLKARLDFTSIGHVLVIFGLPSNQDKFQRELLMKYRELEDENSQKQLRSNLNVPKRTDVLIKFLRDNISQLLSNLGNVNYLLKRLQFLERQQSKSGSKLAEKVRRSLNMILVGQAGLQDGTMHLDKLLLSLKNLINNNNSEDFTPPELRSEITDHWKVIFTPYRHENYQQLVNTYNKLTSKNRMPKLNIDPVLLGHKVLDTSFSEEQKQKLEQAAGTHVASATTEPETPKQIVPNPLNQKNTKVKRKQNATANTTSSQITPISSKTKTPPASRPGSPTKAAQTTSAGRGGDNSTPATKTKSTINNTATPLKLDKTPTNTSIAGKTKSATSATQNKSKQTTNSSSNAAPKKQTQKLMPPPEKRSTVNTTIQQASDKWKSTCDTLLTEISSDKPKLTNDQKKRDSKLPSTFWSRKSMRYLDECTRLIGAKTNIVEKLQRVQNKSKNGQLSYNDYLAVIKLHTALSGK